MVLWETARIQTVFVYILYSLKEDIVSSDETVCVKLICRAGYQQN